MKQEQIRFGEKYQLDQQKKHLQVRKFDNRDNKLSIFNHLS